MSRRADAFAAGAGEAAPLRWHAAITNPSYDFIVRDIMQERGIDTVLPVVRYWRIRNRRREIAERPLLARCVIFGLDPAWQDIRGIRGLERVVKGASDSWARLPANEVYDLRFAILRGDFDATLREAHSLRPLPDLIRRLITDGYLPAQAGLTHKEARRAGLKFSVVA